MAEEKPEFDYYGYEESQMEKFNRKAKQAPFVVIGIASCLGAVGYGAWAYKRRGAMSTSVFLMQFRVIAQGAAVSALTAGMLYTVYDNYLKPKLFPVSQPSQH